MSKAHWRLRAIPPPLDPFGRRAYDWLRVGQLYVPSRFEALVVRARDGDRVWPVLALRLVVAGERPEIVELSLTHNTPRVFDDQKVTIFTSMDGTAFQRINSSLLRHFPLKEIAEQAMQGVAFRHAEPPAFGAEPVIPYDRRDSAGFYRLEGDEGPDDHPFEGTYEPELPRWEEKTFANLAFSVMQADLAHRLEGPTTRRGKRITSKDLADTADIYRQAIQEGKPPKQAVAKKLHRSEATAGRWIQRAREEGFLGPTRPGKKGESDT